jgi:hypothetical protein
MKLFLRKLHGQWYFGTQIVETHYVEIFSLLKIKKEVDLIMFQIMRYIICYNSLILNLNPKTQGRRELIIYDTTNGITTF